MTEQLPRRLVIAGNRFEVRSCREMPDEVRMHDETGFLEYPVLDQLSEMIGRARTAGDDGKYPITRLLGEKLAVMLEISCQDGCLPPRNNGGNLLAVLHFLCGDVDEVFSCAAFLDSGDVFSQIQRG